MTKKKIGVSSTPPVNEAQQGPSSLARLLRLPTGKKAKRESKARETLEKVVDNIDAAEVIPSQLENSAEAIPQQRTDNPTNDKRTIMDITLNRDSKTRKSTSIVYNATGFRGGVRLPKSAFKDGNAPDTITVSSDVFAEPKQPRAKMTPEERKAARAAQPKLTLAQKIAKREEQLAALKAKAASQPSL